MRVQSHPVAAVQRLLDSSKRAGLDRLKAVLACTFTFDRGYFEQLLEALAECHLEGSDVLRSIPIDVVCDHRHYHGHGAVGYNVHCWSGDNLFHPKLLLLLFADRVVWTEGSLNLTRAGYTVNQELVTFHENRRCKLPHGVRELMRHLADQEVDAAKRVLNATGGERTDVRNRSVTSLDSALLDGMLNRVKRAHSVYVVAPFFDHREQAGPVIESTALRALAKQYPHAEFRIFLPQITRADGSCALQGSKALFVQTFGPRVQVNRLGLCGVPSDERPLHAKLLAIRHGKQGARATVLTGSPNLTEKALLKTGPRANVELAREFTLRWTDVDEILRPLGRRFRQLSGCIFEPPKLIAATGWHALKSAIYHPLRRELMIEWRGPDYAQRTLLCYAGRRLNAQVQDCLKGFAIRDGELRLEAVCRADPDRRSWCPIVIPIESRLSLAELPNQGDPPPEWWLAQLGALPATGNADDRPPGAGAGGVPAGSASFPLGQRVRDLADRMRYVIEVISDSDTSGSARVVAHYEAAFLYRDVLVRVDVLERTPTGWNLVEVKSGTKFKDGVHDIDVAIQLWVLRGAGLVVENAGLLTLNRGYVYDGVSYDLEQLFLLHDCLDIAESLQSEVEQNIEAFMAMLDAGTPPVVVPGEQCTKPYDCAYYAHCTRGLVMPEYPVSELPGIRRHNIERLNTDGVDEITEVPDDYPLTPLQDRVRNAVLTQTEYISDDLGNALSGIFYPVYHLDFETFTPAIPRFSGTRPYDAIPFQYSLHVEYEDGRVEHLEFLHEKDSDPRAALTASLIDALGDIGTVCVYSGYEKRIINALADRFPEYSDSLDAILDRLWDLLTVLREHYYHPDFHGSFSIKKVLPILVPELGYDNLAIQDGQTAGLSYLNSLEESDMSARQRMLADLRAYCGMDTEAMVRLRKALMLKTQATAR